MSTFEISSHIGPDGSLRITVPAEFANSDVRVVVEHVGSASGTASNGAVRPSTPAEWRSFIHSTAGTSPGFPDVREIDRSTL